MPTIDRIPGQDTRTRRAFAGIGVNFVPYTGAIYDVNLGAFNFTTTGVVTAANLVLSDKNGIDFTHATDEDVDIIELSGITGDPKMYWDESEDRFRFTKGLFVDVNVGILGSASIGTTLNVTGLATVGELDVDTLNLSGNVISDSTGTISFDNDDLLTTGDLSCTLVGAGVTNATVGGVTTIIGLATQDDSFALGAGANLMAGYFVATDGELLSSGTIRGIEVKARAKNGAANGTNVLEAISASADAKDQTVTTLRGAELILDGKAGAAVTTAIGLRIANNFQADIAATSYGIYIYSDSFDLDYALYSTAGDVELTAGNLTTTGLGTLGSLVVDSPTLVVNIAGYTDKVGIGTATPSNTIEVKDLIKFDDTEYNTFVGKEVFHNSEQDHNTGLGHRAGYNNNHLAGDDGKFNTCVGHYSLHGADAGDGSTGYFNTAIGAYSLYKNTTGYKNAAIGGRVLYANTTGNRNSGVGMDALRYNTEGYRNSAIGYWSLYFNTTGNYNSAIGAYSLYKNTTGYENTAMGETALYSNKTGYRNSAIGYRSLFSNKTGYENMAIGRFALYANTTGYWNLAVGQGSMYANTTGYENVVVGDSGLVSNTTGYINVAIGSRALYSLLPTSKAITAFADNGDGKTRVTSVGHGRANGIWIQISGTTNYNGAWLTEQVAADTLVINTAFVANDATGWWAILSEGRRNIALGAYAGYRQTTISDSLLIDNRVRASAAVELTDAIIYGKMASTPAAQDLFLNADVFLKADNRKLYFGGGDDASLYYDGTDLWIDSDVVGTGSLKIGDATNYTQIKPDGELNLHGTARVIRHLRVGAASWDKGAAAPTAGFEGVFSTLDFDAVLDDEAHYTIIVPHRWDTTIDIEFAVDWFYDGGQDNGTVCWALEYKAIKAGEAVTGAGTTITKVSAGTHTTGQMVRTTFTTKILAANLEAGDTLGFRLYRDVSADTLATDARLINTHFHFTMNKLGLAT